MGTRSLTIFTDERGNELSVLYRQYDGYLDGHGKELAEMLSGKNLVDGFNPENALESFNGMGCLAASVISNFKIGIGGFYLYPIGSRDIGQDYTYFISGKTGEEPRIRVESYGDEICEGKASEILDKINNGEIDG